MAEVRRLKESASQTAGPYVHIGTMPNGCGIPGVYPNDLGLGPLFAESGGQRIVVTGRIIDGDNVPLKDALVEIWQADANGRYPKRSNDSASNDRIGGWGRQPTDGTTGIYRFETIKPGQVAYVDGRLMAPHITFWIVARGINIGLQTRLYFSDEVDANAADPVLGMIAPRERVSTLIAARSDVAGKPTYTFDIHLQGPQETIFFDI
jgi:protocatechuate 3,4-dioxygenase alpha subunit